MNTTNNAITEAVYYILLALVEPMHGYGIMQQTAVLSKDRLRLSAGTLYGALASLLDKGWIEQLPEEGRKKDYRITPAGREVLEQELQRLAELLENGRNILNSQNE
jgi:DNA-binding PadR family transcriptional regulator